MRGRAPAGGGHAAVDDQHPVILTLELLFDQNAAGNCMRQVPRATHLLGVRRGVPCQGNRRSIGQQENGYFFMIGGSPACWYCPVPCFESCSNCP